jgi:hypothetical protein
MEKTVMYMERGTDKDDGPLVPLRRAKSGIEDLAVASQYKMGGNWYSSYPELRECHDLAMFLVDEVKIESVEMNEIGLARASTPRSSWISLQPSRIARGHGRLNWQRLLNWPTWGETRRGNEAWHWEPRPSSPLLTPRG